MSSPSWQWQYAQPGPYQTHLTPQEEHIFRYWVQANRVPFDPNNFQSDYDMRGFWKGLTTGDSRATTAINPNDNRMHFPDTWKTPYHQSFSAQSMYATPDAPNWINSYQLADQKGNVLFDEKAQADAAKTQRFLPSGISQGGLR